MIVIRLWTDIRDVQLLFEMSLVFVIIITFLNMSWLNDKKIDDIISITFWLHYDYVKFTLLCMNVCFILIIVMHTLISDICTQQYQKV